MLLILIKVLVAVVLVVSLVYVSERDSKLGGLIVGLPLGTGVMVFFYGVEQGVDFVVESVPYGIAGLLSTIFFGIGFFIGGKILKNKPFLNVFIAYLGGLITYLISSFILSGFSINLVLSLCIFAFSFIVSFIFFKNVKDNEKVIRRKFNFPVLLFRILFVVAIVLTITGLAEIIGSKWAGIIASYPTVISPLLIILAYSYGDKVYPTLLKHLSYSFSTLVVFYLVVLVIFPIVGVYYGTLIAYIVCILYLMGINFIQKRFFPDFSRVSSSM